MEREKAAKTLNQMGKEIEFDPVIFALAFNSLTGDPDEAARLVAGRASNCESLLA